MDARKLDKEAAKTWIAGQEAAQRACEQERVKRLQSLTPEASLQVYLALVAAADQPSTRRAHAKPSPVLRAMREATRRLTDRQGKA